MKTIGTSATIDTMRSRGATVTEVSLPHAADMAAIYLHLVFGDAALNQRKIAGPIALGEERFVDRLQSYVDLASTLRDRVARLDYVDLRFDERIYVRPQAVGRRRGE